MADVYVGRDPFARGAYLRRSCKNDSKGCYWCGNKTRKTMLMYTWVSDDRNRKTHFSVDQPYFCNFGCFNSYYDIHGG